MGFGGLEVRIVTPQLPQPAHGLITEPTSPRTTRPSFPNTTLSYRLPAPYTRLLLQIQAPFRCSAASPPRVVVLAPLPPDRRAAEIHPRLDPLLPLLVRNPFAHLDMRRSICYVE
jgi:hypothetical protein